MSDSFDVAAYERGLAAYYRERAPFYHKQFNRPGHPIDAAWREMAGEIREVLRGRRVLELACGTGFFTEFAAETAERVLATDLSDEMLAEARRRSYPRGNVAFGKADAFALHEVGEPVDAVLAVQWFSHVPKVRYADLLGGINARLGRGGVVYLADGGHDAQAVPGTMPGRAKYLKPGFEDVYSLRQAQDSERSYEIVKNHFKSEAEMRAVFGPYAANLETRLGEFFWRAWYTAP
ncbi:MAG: class I SAM-dependent methyltransferase [Planctomycetota bacterium]|nr:class I SAM-dependent methyltransferase [Planctomycetota bacterium]